MRYPTKQFIDLRTPERPIGAQPTELTEEDTAALLAYSVAADKVLDGPLSKGNTAEASPAIASQAVSPLTTEELREDPNKDDDFLALIDCMTGGGGDDPRAVRFSRDTARVVEDVEDTLNALGIDAPDVDEQEAGGRLAAAKIDRGRKQLDNDPLTERGDAARSIELRQSTDAMLGGEVINTLYGHDNHRIYDVLVSFEPADAAEVARRAGEIAHKYGDAAHAPNEVLAAFGAYIESLPYTDQNREEHPEEMIETFGKSLEQIETPQDLFVAMGDENRQRETLVSKGRMSVW